MPKIDIYYKKPDGEEIKVIASGWFFCSLNVSNNPKSKIKKWIKEYDTGEKDKDG